MKFLFCAATEMELGATFPQAYPNTGFEAGQAITGPRGDYLVHGVGVTETTLNLTQHLAKQSDYDCIIQVGVCGLYPHAARVQQLYVTELVHVIEEAFGDLGAETPTGFIPLERLLPNEYVELSPSSLYPELAGSLLEFIPELEFLPKVRGLTVSNITGTQETAQERESIFHAEVESMEGASASRVAQEFNIPFLQIRSISNLASTRDQSSWRMKEALGSLKEFFLNV